MKMVVTGRAGQLVCCLIERAAAQEAKVFAVGRPELDLADPVGGLRYIEDLRPDVIVSAAAYTGVDQAETDIEAAHAVNGRAPGFLADLAARQNIPIIHISTDYVFDGSKPLPYVESDPTNPLGVYGGSKLIGERAIAKATLNHVILRTSWVYSPFGNNFVRTMLRLASQRPEISVVADQSGNPTSALDLADAVYVIARNLLAEPQKPALRGTFHAAGTGETNWALFAAEIMSISSQLGGPSAVVRPISTAEYPTPAQRPANSRLDSSKLRHHHGVLLPPWQHSTRDVVVRLLREQDNAAAKRS